MNGRPLRVLAFALLAAVAACSPPRVDLQQALEVTEFTSGWVDAGLKDGKTRILPTISFRLKKRDASELTHLSLNIAFRKDNPEQEAFDDIYLQRVEIGADGQSAPITVRADTGYTGDPPQTAQEMLDHSMFQNLDVRVAGRQGGSQWTDLHTAKIERRIVVQ